MRGTFLLESMHQNLTKSFGHTMSGMLFSNCLITLLRHHINWKLYERNQADFHQVRHYNDFLVDYVNELYWELSTKYMVDTSPYGIVPIYKEGPESHHVEPAQGLTKSLHYLSFQQ